MAGHYLEILIAVSASTAGRPPSSHASRNASRDAADHRQSGCADVDYNVTVKLS
jgi:hypothetical protein